jgi:hypothetical protein
MCIMKVLSFFLPHSVLYKCRVGPTVAAPAPAGNQVTVAVKLARVTVKDIATVSAESYLLAPLPPNVFVCMNCRLMVSL